MTHCTKSERDAAAGLLGGPLLDYKGLALWLGIHARTAKRWVAEGRLPAPDLRVGQVVRWYPKTIQRWAKQRKSS